MTNISTERLIEIESEREKTMVDDKFQKWMRKLNVSRMYIDKQGTINANELMKQYDMSKYKYIINI